MGKNFRRHVPNESWLGRRKLTVPSSPRRRWLWLLQLAWKNIIPGNLSIRHHPLQAKTDSDHDETVVIAHDEITKVGVGPVSPKVS